MRAHVPLCEKHGGGWVDFIDGRLLVGVAHIVRRRGHPANVFDRKCVQADADHVGVSLGEDWRRKLATVLDRAKRDLRWHLGLDGRLRGPVDCVRLRVLVAHLLPQSGQHIDVPELALLRIHSAGPNTFHDDRWTLAARRRLQGIWRGRAYPAILGPVLDHGQEVPSRRLSLGRRRRALCTEVRESRGGAGLR
jgi:hypothetical protein